MPPFPLQSGSHLPTAYLGRLYFEGCYAREEISVEVEMWKHKSVTRLLRSGKCIGIVQASTSWADVLHVIDEVLHCGT